MYFVSDDFQSLYTLQLPQAISSLKTNHFFDSSDSLDSLPESTPFQFQQFFSQDLWYETITQHAITSNNRKTFLGNQPKCLPEISTYLHPKTINLSSTVRTLGFYTHQEHNKIGLIRMSLSETNTQKKIWSNLIIILLKHIIEYHSVLWILP